MAQSSLQSLGELSGLDIRPEDLERAISRRNPKAAPARIEQVVNLLGRLAEASGVLAELAASPPRSEVHVGAGLGPSLELAEGKRRLSAFAAPLALEDWAGPCAGPSEIAAKFGIARSTLDEWRRSGAAIGLLAGARKHVYPLAQFVDGRPIEGLAALASIVGDPRSVWLWLVAPASKGRSWLERLRNGERTKVLAGAREDFG